MTDGTILIVEDDPLVGMMIADMVDALGFGVPLVCETMAAAQDALGTGDVAAALLDVNLGGVKIWPFADRLAALGVPYAFLSGGGSAPPAPHDSRPMVMKPFRITDVETLLSRMINAN